MTAVIPSHYPLITHGITYRQVDYWVRKGYVAATLPGIGYDRSWPRAEAAVVTRMCPLVAAGISPEAAAIAARGDLLPHGVQVTCEGWTSTPAPAKVSRRGSRVRRARTPN